MNVEASGSDRRATLAAEMRKSVKRFSEKMHAQTTRSSRVEASAYAPLFAGKAARRRGGMPSSIRCLPTMCCDLRRASAIPWRTAIAPQAQAILLVGIVGGRRPGLLAQRSKFSMTFSWLGWRALGLQRPRSRANLLNFCEIFRPAASPRSWADDRHARRRRRMKSANYGVFSRGLMATRPAPKTA